MIFFVGFFTDAACSFLLPFADDSCWLPCGFVLCCDLVWGGVSVVGLVFIVGYDLVVSAPVYCLGLWYLVFGSLCLAIDFGGLGVEVGWRICCGTPVGALGGGLRVSFIAWFWYFGGYGAAGVWMRLGGGWGVRGCGCFLVFGWCFGGACCDVVVGFWGLIDSWVVWCLNFGCGDAALVFGFGWFRDAVGGDWYWYCGASVGGAS